MSPRAPAVAMSPPTAPRAPAVVTKSLFDSEPPSGGWDAADTATSFPDPEDLPVPTPRNLPAVNAALAAASSAAAHASSPAAAAQAAGAHRAPYPTAPGVGAAVVPAAVVPAAAAPAAPRAATATSAMATGAGLGSAMREEVWAIVRAAVEEATTPLLARQRELEAQLERAERFIEASNRVRGGVGAAAPDAQGRLAAPNAAAPTPAAGASASSRLASLGATPAPAPALVANAFHPQSAEASRIEPPPSAAALTAPEPARAPDNAVARAAPHPVGPRPSFAPTGYGVAVMASTRQSLDLDSVGAVDIEGFDGGRRKKRVGAIVAVLMLLIIAAVVTMTVLSHS